MKKKSSIILYLICSLLLFAACGNVQVENNEKLADQEVMEEIQSTDPITEPTAENADQEPEIRSSIPRKMIVSELQDDEYIFISCLDVTKELETHKNDTPRENREPANGDEGIYIDPNDTSKYQWAPKESKPDTSVVMSDKPGKSVIPVGNTTQIPFWGYGKDTILSENAEYINANGAGFSLYVSGCEWEPKESCVEIGFCNLDTKTCYGYPVVSDCGYVRDYFYDFSELPVGTYRFYVRKTLGDPLTHSFLRFEASSRPVLTVVE